MIQYATVGGTSKSTPCEGGELNMFVNLEEIVPQKSSHWRIKSNLELIYARE